MYILGISAYYHESSIALIKKDKIICFIKEEWLTRIKGDNSFPPKNLEEYEKLILNIKNINLKIEKAEIYEYYFMRHIYNSKNWLIDDLEDFMNFVGSWTYMNSYKFYEYWLKNISENKEKKLNRTIENFINSSDDATNISHTLEKY